MIINILQILVKLASDCLNKLLLLIKNILTFFFLKELDYTTITISIFFFLFLVSRLLQLQRCIQFLTFKILKEKWINIKLSKVIKITCWVWSNFILVVKILSLVLRKTVFFYVGNLHFFVFLLQCFGNVFLSHSLFLSWSP